MAGATEIIPAQSKAPPEEEVKKFPHLEDDELIRTVENSEHGPKFKKLMAGEWNGLDFESESAARFGLLELIAWYADSRRRNQVEPMQVPRFLFLCVVYCGLC